MEVFLFLAQGFEETEVVATLDVLIRGGLEVTSVSITGKRVVEGAHGIFVIADQLFEEADFSQGDLLILPGGQPGTDHLNAHAGLKSLLVNYHNEGKWLAAICAAPLVLGELNLLRGRQATVYPSYEDRLLGAVVSDLPLVKDGKIITARGPGYVFDFALAIVSELQGRDRAEEVAEGLLYNLSI
jgi:4-methyl-5(b-hydroxyethyl)-thiazole monophosphate biosynthesis